MKRRTDQIAFDIVLEYMSPALPQERVFLSEIPEAEKNQLILSLWEDDAFDLDFINQADDFSTFSDSLRAMMIHSAKIQFSLTVKNQMTRYYAMRAQEALDDAWRRRDREDWYEAGFLPGVDQQTGESTWDRA